jgi:hypothetical protein
MKFGIIGAGMIGHFHAKAIQSMTGSSLHSVFDLRLESAEKLALEYGCKAFSKLAAFLADPELEVVTIGTPSGAHRDPAIAALQAGKHVICEKPLEITTERIDEMITAAKAAGKTLSAVLNRRFQPAIESLKLASDQNRFGRITSASAQIKWWRTQEYYDSGAWRGTWALDGGGALIYSAPEEDENPHAKNAFEDIADATVQLYEAIAAGHSDPSVLKVRCDVLVHWAARLCVTRRAVVRWCAGCAFAGQARAWPRAVGTMIRGPTSSGERSCR